MKLRWDKYWYDLWSSIFKHVGTALAGWGGLNIAHSSGADVPALDWKALGIFMLAAGVIPAVAAFWQKQPLPEVEETIITQTTTVATTKAKEEPTA